MRRINRKPMKKSSDKIITYSMIGVAVFLIAVIAILVSMSNKKPEENSEFAKVEDKYENTSLTSTTERKNS